MKVEHSTAGLKIILPRYKINVKKLKTSSGKTTYQYSCILPPILCSFFNIKDNTTDENVLDYNALIFYNSNQSNYIISAQLLYQAYAYLDNLHLYNMSVDMGIPPKKELVEQVENTPLNVKLYDELKYNLDNVTRVYKLTNSNSFRVTLPRQLFKDKVNPDEENYIQFIIDTSEEDLLTNKGVVKYTLER